LILLGANLDFDDLQSAKSYIAMKTYGRSKLCTRRLRGSGVTTNCLHPGFVATRFGDQSGGLISRFVWLAQFFAISPTKCARTIVYLASSPEVAEATGQYFYRCLPTTPSSLAQDDVAALEL
jgi:NAD(P)-dependent dehydrogenase (short-subunit alcohol dehydrogenase family)